MTWKELTEKYREYWEEYFLFDPFAIVIGDGPLVLRFEQDGTVKARYVDLGKVATYMTIATNRTPEQMDNIIKSLTESTEND
jgi:hypothetical protein